MSKGNRVFRWAYIRGGEHSFGWLDDEELRVLLHDPIRWVSGGEDPENLADWALKEYGSLSFVGPGRLAAQPDPTEWGDYEIMLLRVEILVPQTQTRVTEWVLPE